MKSTSKDFLKRFLPVLTILLVLFLCILFVTKRNATTVETNMVENEDLSAGLTDVDSTLANADSTLATQEVSLIGGSFIAEENASSTEESVESVEDTTILSEANETISEDASSSSQSETKVSVLEYGAVGDGKTDDTVAIMSAISENTKVYFPEGTYKIDISCASSLSSKNIYGEGSLKFTSWSKQAVLGTYTNVYDGICEIPRMNDPVYMAAHWPSEALMTEDSRTNICVSTEVKMSNDIRKICYHGGIVRVKDVEIPENFTICLGIGQLYAYKNNQWVLLREGLPNFALFDASWKNPSISVPNENIARFDDHIEVSLNKSLWFPDGDEMLLHYFCPSYELSAEENAADYEYYFATYTAWVKDASYSDCFSFGVSADMRDTNNNIYELGIGKNYLLKSEPRTAYFYNVPDSKYDELIASHFN